MGTPAKFQTRRAESGHVTESIYSSASVVIPLADVQHIEKSNPLGIIIVTKHTRWDADGDFWANSIWIDAAEASAFMRAWCQYRAELEADTLANLEPEDAPDAERIHPDSQFGVGA